MSAQDQVPPGTGESAAGSAPQYEFSAEQNKTISGVAWGFKILGYVFALTSFKILVRLVRGIIYLADGGGRPVSTGDVIEFGCLVVLFVPLTVWMFQSSSGFEDVVKTEGRDIDHLMNGMRSLRRSFRWVIGIAIAAAIAGLLIPLAMWIRSSSS